jgi:endonuclease/exonuclease/phosphatase family metal-dependent hydrolase
MAGHAKRRILRAVTKALTWNLYHGRDFPPNPELRTWRSRLLRTDERDETHLQVNRDLFDEFAGVLARAEWDVGLLQECPPRWTLGLASACSADAHVSLTSRNSLSGLRAILAHQNPDLMASSEGGANLTLVRGDSIAERRELVLTTRPERRTMAFSGLATGLCVANLHASNAAPPIAGAEVLAAAARAIEWAEDRPLLFGGDLNLRPDRAGAVFAELAVRYGLSAPTAPNAIDHLLAHALETLAPPVRWVAERREVTGGGGLAIRLSDHAPVEATFA